MKLQNKVAAVTGAGSGIGRALAIEFAAQGCEVAISDVNEAGLEETRKLAAGKGVKVTARKLDVADRAAMEAWAAAVALDHGRVNIIVNNAGVALGTTVDGMNYKDVEWLMSINFWGVVYGTTAFLPLIKQAGEGSVVNISSVFGFIGVPTQSAYNAAKFAVRGFTESLQQELDIENCGVNAICVHPGGIRTNIARNSRMGNLGALQRSQASVAEDFDKIARTSPAQAATVIINAIKSGKRRVLIGADAHLIDWVQRFFPRQYQRLNVAFAALNKSKAAKSQKNEKIGV
jgi:NAD(P)-dependent dehydrogenase (short-subunit alcohol dehydrogenase family)